MFDEISKNGKWWDKALTLVTGCTNVSEGCRGCWERDIAHRFSKRSPRLPAYEGTLTDKNEWSGVVKTHLRPLMSLSEKQKPTAFAVWTDLFHPKVKIDFHMKVFKKIAECQNHVFIICTKRPYYAFEIINEVIDVIPGCELSNVIMMLTAETQGRYDERINDFLRIPLRYKALSLEPLLGMIDLHLERYASTTIDEKLIGQIGDNLCWVITGGETNNRLYKDARPSLPEYFNKIRVQCTLHNIPYCHKHNGVYISKKDGGMKKVSKTIAGRRLNGLLYSEFPQSVLSGLKVQTTF